MTLERPDWSARQPIASTLTDSGAISASENGTTGSLVALVAGQSVQLVQASLDPEAQTATGVMLRGWVVVVLTDASSGAILARGSIGPAAPHCDVPIPFGAGRAGVGHGVNATAYSEPGVGDQSVRVTLAYYYVS